MTVFPVNPLTDFGVDLAELWALRCSAAQMAAMGITFDQLLAKSITPQIRSAFAMSSRSSCCCEWISSAVASIVDRGGELPRRVCF